MRELTAEAIQTFNPKQLVFAIIRIYQDFISIEQKQILLKLSYDRALQILKQTPEQFTPENTLQMFLALASADPSIANPKFTHQIVKHLLAQINEINEIDLLLLGLNFFYIENTDSKNYLSVLNQYHFKDLRSNKLS